MMIEALKPQDFEGLADGELMVSFGGRQFPLQVAELRALPRVSPREEPFSLLLKGPRDLLMPQGIQMMEHPRLGRLPLFIVPVALDGTHSTYEVIFN